MCHHIYSTFLIQQCVVPHTHGTVKFIFLGFVGIFMNMLGSVAKLEI